jgi:hypothetical protein
MSTGFSAGALTGRVSSPCRLRWFAGGARVVSMFAVVVATEGSLNAPTETERPGGSCAIRGRGDATVSRASDRSGVPSRRSGSRALASRVAVTAPTSEDARRREKEDGARKSSLVGPANAARDRARRSRSALGRGRPPVFVR